MNLVVKIIIVGVVVFGFLLNFIWQKTDAVIIDNQYHFSNEDIDKLFDVEVQLGEIIGTSVVQKKADVLYNLVISSLQKSILNKHNIELEKANATEFVEKNQQNFKGFYKKFKEQMGVDDYYQLLIEPVAINGKFLSFYNAVEPAKQRANAALALAQKDGLEAAAKQLNKEIKEVNINENNSALKAEFLQFKTKDLLSVIYPKPVKIGDNIAVLDLDFKEDTISAKALVFKIIPYQNFLVQLSKKISIQFPFFSRYNLADIHNKKGSILK
ncbi:MAG: hypothetical protein HAW58_00305 [Candidatus Thioglobus sp.]|nr:hypothetical protein [Candidatus Thioglobus sp.]